VIGLIGILDNNLLIDMAIENNSVILQANFLWKITFDMLYNNGFLIGICFRTFSIILRT